jgi:fatty acid synthase
VHAQWLADVDSVTGYEQTGCAASMFANRLSWFYNFKGPSKIVDTGAAQACSLMHLEVLFSFSSSCSPDIQ